MVQWQLPPAFDEAHTWLRPAKELVDLVHTPTRGHIRNVSAPSSQRCAGVDVFGHFVDTGSNPTGPDLCVSAGQGLFSVAGA